jgi:hypothetical protein
MFESNLVRLFMLGVLLGMTMAVGILNSLWWVALGSVVISLVIIIRAYYLCREILEVNKEEHDTDL